MKLAFILVIIAATYVSGNFLKIKCRRAPLFATLSPSCKLFLSTSTTPTPSSTPIPSTTTVSPTTTRTPFTSRNTTSRIHTIQAHTSTLASWMKALISICASIATLYTSLVSFLKLKRGWSAKRALSLGIYPDHRSQGVNASDLPIPLRNETTH